MNTEYLVIGSGLTGSVIARILFDNECGVQVIERRNHIAGNVHDHVHVSGIPIHSYGPHYFRTNSDDLWRFVNRFSSFRPYVARVLTLVDGQCEHWPVVNSYIKRVAGTDNPPIRIRKPRNFEEAALNLMPQVIYEKFVRGYTEKQWGIAAIYLAPELVRRFEVREDEDTRLFRHRYQGIPTNGYTEFVRRMLDGIPLLLNVDYLRHRNVLTASCKIIFTGPIDEYFDFDLGRLAYRGQQREHTYHPNAGFLLDCAQINNPDPALGAHIRTLEWKHMMDPA